ncbi:hypothetical protein MBRA1_001078 [Malassezia brasiliensis]|uniref:Uncharacterized protein n=1 Tax=Malassezia brasiliensis TaxID=1821822 RepID=A0AAF0DS50_9BASI|nr:hypothetical protein MBRA1_001078 [Malassezia brasiliensis]
MSQTGVSRSSRQRCWESRDVYYACLTKNGIHAPPGTDMSGTPGPLGRGAFRDPPRSEAERVQKAADERKNDPCTPLRNEYEGNCAKSWVDYFNKRRVLDERQKQFYAEAEARVAAGNRA